MTRLCVCFCGCAHACVSCHCRLKYC